MKDSWAASVWMILVGAFIGASAGTAVATILNALEVAGGGVHNSPGVATFVGTSFALGFWSLTWAVTNRD